MGVATQAGKRRSECSDLHVGRSLAFRNSGSEPERAIARTRKPRTAPHYAETESNLGRFRLYPGTGRRRRARIIVPATRISKVITIMPHWDIVGTGFGAVMFFGGLAWFIVLRIVRD